MAVFTLCEGGDDYDMYWECSACGEWFLATKKIEKAKVCPKCGARIEEFIDELNDNDYNGGNDE